MAMVDQARLQSETAKNNGNRTEVQGFIDKLNQELLEQESGRQSQDKKKKEISEGELIGMIKQNKLTGRKFNGAPSAMVGGPRPQERRS